MVSENPETREVQERLRGCMYTMSHPDIGQLVPACVQHAVMDPAENAGLRKLLPPTPPRTRSVAHAPLTSPDGKVLA